MKIITNINDSFPPRTQSSPCSNSNAQCCYIICYLLFRRQKCKRLIISATWPHFLRFYWFMTCCHEVISAYHMDYIFLQFDAEMNQIVYSGRYRETGAYGLLRVRSRARVATGPKSIALLLLWFLKFFFFLSLVIFLLGEGRDWSTFCVFLIICVAWDQAPHWGKKAKKSA